MATVTYEADTDGTLIEIVVPEGETVALGEVIARIGEAGEEKQADEGEQEDEDSDQDQEEPEAEEPEEEEEEPEPEPEPDEPEEESDDERTKASPVARRVANELGVDIADVQGSGPGGRILKADVEKAAGEDGGAPEKAPEKSEKRKKDK